MPSFYVDTRDLFFRTRLQDVVRRIGTVVGTPEALQPPGIVLLDLGGFGEPEEISRRIAEYRARGLTVVAFGPHRDSARLATARAAGARVTSNSALFRDPFGTLRAAWDPNALPSDAETEDAAQRTDQASQEHP